jgi:adenosylhomocysteine/aminodeoxyfutalosine nucleosidase
MKKKLFTTAFSVVVSLICGEVLHASNLAFFYALDADFQNFKAQAAGSRPAVKVGNHSVQVVTIATFTVYCTKMGAGTVETATSVEALLGRFQCDRAFSLGPIGALNDQLDIGHWYVPGTVIAYQKGSWTNSGFQRGDRSTIELGKMPDNVPALFKNLPAIKVASGEIFVASTNYRSQLRGITQGDAVDMNLFGLLSACESNHVPSVNFRIVSDKADDNAGRDFAEFAKHYDGAGGKAVAELIKSLPPDPNSPQSYPALEKLLQPHSSPSASK